MHGLKIKYKASFLFLAIISCLGCLPMQLFPSEFKTLEGLNIPYLRDAKPYIRCNEFGQEKILRILSELSQPKNALHIGWSIEFNYRILCARKPQLAILCDINKRVFEFFDLFKELVLEAESCAEFLDLLEENLCSHNFIKTPRTSKQIIVSYASWLSLEDNFTYLKTMYAEERIIHLVLDLMDEDGRFTKLMEWIKSSGYTIDTLYLSNIGMWVCYQPPFLSNLSRLVHENIIYIDSHRIPGKGLSLRATLGSIPDP